MTERKALKEVEENLRLIANPTPEQLGEVFNKVEGSRYYTLWHRYRQRASFHESIQDAFHTYFDAEVMKRVLGSRSWSETVSQVHIALGVLGSFLSVVRAWSTGGINQEGMIIALYPFLWGVILFVLWLIADRILVAPLEGKVDHYAGMMVDILSRDHHEQWIKQRQREMVEVLEKGLYPLLQQMKRVEEKRMGEREEMLEQLRSIDHWLQTMEKEGTKREVQFMEMMESQEKSLGLLLHTMQEATTGLVSVIPKLKDVVQGLGTWKGELQQIQEGQRQALVELAADREQYYKLAEQQVGEMEQHVKEVSKQVTAMQSQWAATKEEFIDARRKLDHSIKSFTKEIDQGLGRTFEHFDTELTKAMQKFSQLNHHLKEQQEQLLWQLGELTKLIQSMESSDK